MSGDWAALCPEHGVERCEDFGPKCPEVGEDHADIVAAAAQDSMERITERALESVTGEAAIRFHVADHRLDRAAPTQVAPERRRHPALLPRDVDRRGRHAVTAVAAIHEGPLRTGVGQDLHLLQGFTQRVSVVRIAGHRPHAYNEALLVGRRHRHLGPELVAHPSFALGDAVHFRLVQRVKLALVLRLLPQQPVHEDDLRLEALPQAVVRHSTKLALDVPHDPAGIALQPPQGLAHPLELPGMGIAPDRPDRRGPSRA